MQEWLCKQQSECHASCWQAFLVNKYICFYLQVILPAFQCTYFSLLWQLAAAAENSAKVGPSTSFCASRNWICFSILKYAFSWGNQTELEHSPSLSDSILSFPFLSFLSPTLLLSSFSYCFSSSYDFSVCKRVNEQQYASIFTAEHVQWIPSA